MASFVSSPDDPKETLPSAPSVLQEKGRHKWINTIVWEIGCQDGNGAMLSFTYSVIVQAYFQDFPVEAKHQVQVQSPLMRRVLSWTCLSPKTPELGTKSDITSAKKASLAARCPLGLGHPSKLLPLPSLYIPLVPHVTCVSYCPLTATTTPIETQLGVVREQAMSYSLHTQHQKRARELQRAVWKEGGIYRCFPPSRKSRLHSLHYIKLKNRKRVCIFIFKIKTHSNIQMILNLQRHYVLINPCKLKIL